MADFRTSYNIVRQHEGGYANNVKDRGGETYKGIARKFWQSWQGWKLIDQHKAQTKSFESLLEQDAELQSNVLAFYKANFWNALSLDQVQNQPIANELFDTSVNMSVVTGATFAQRSLNVLNRCGKLYPDVLVDGQLGPKTIQVINAHPDPKQLLKVLNVLQGAKYVAICEADPSQEIFMNSWFSRVALY